jgi:UDP-2,3-diacylglucosamine pyrophosphatase LpxH
MKKAISLFIGMMGTIIILFASCNKDNEEVMDPFSNGSSERNMIVVISDLHMGADLAYAECKENLKPLENFLNKVKASPNVKELVIAGDLLDEWFVPAYIDTYHGKDQQDFVQRIAVSNKAVMDVFNKIIQEGKILVTYVPGNHDLTITPENIEMILPGIRQVRDAELGLGTYSPDGFPLLAVEHGHRYNFFCAPDPFSNQDVAPGTILPPGYFFTRIGALHVDQDFPTTGETPPLVTPNTSGDVHQNLMYEYWKMWQFTTTLFKINNPFDEKMIVTNVDGFTETYAVDDVLPFQSPLDGSIDVNLYGDIVDTWEARQTRNHVPVHIPSAHAIANSASAVETDSLAYTQYFANPDSDKRLVVFGHSHVPQIIAYTNLQGQKCIYANSGTWIDHNPKRTTMHFIVINPQQAEASSKTEVKLYNFEGETYNQMAEDFLRL